MEENQRASNSDERIDQSVQRILGENQVFAREHLLVTYISADERAEKVLENPGVIRQPVVRNGRQATVGYAPEVWKTWQ